MLQSFSRPNHIKGSVILAFNEKDDIPIARQMQEHPSAAKQQQLHRLKLSW